ncbi:MAG: GHKL domain-containing protein [Candidatus Riflebacteria bacterium]|nr:GHKL domain-containing protein [Candidatus Riflebacteria bacterium]
MSSLITALLEYSRVGRQDRPLSPVRLADALADAIKNLSITIEETRSAIAVDELPTVAGDRPQLSMVFQNVIGNAIKFCRPGVRPEIRVASRRDDESDGWIVSIADNGIGIPGDQLERVFLIFQRLHTRDEYPGTGIGLALCRKIVERHGGKIWVESVRGQGSTFRFTVPTVRGMA